MFRDTQEALRRLEEALLTEEQAPDLTEPEDMPSPDSHIVWRNFSNAYGQSPGRTKMYNADRTDEDPETYSRALLKKKKGIGGLLFLAILLTLCIALVAVWWLVRYWGIL